MLRLLPILTALLVAAPAAAAQGDPAAEQLREWLGELSSPDQSKRYAAMAGLRRAGAKAVPVLRGALKREDPGLGERVAKFAAQLKDPDWKKRDDAMRALQKLGRRARPSIAKHGEAGDPETAWRVRAALAAIDDGIQDETAREHARTAAVCDILGDIGGRECVADLIAMLDSDSSAVRKRAALSLSRLRSHLNPGEADGASEKILEHLSSEEDDRTRSILVGVLGRLGSEKSVLPVARVALDPALKDVGVRSAAVHALGRIGSKDALASVVRALDSESLTVRLAAVTVLEGKAGGAHGFDPRRDPADQGAATAKFRAWWEKEFGAEWKE